MIPTSSRLVDLDPWHNGQVSVNRGRARKFDIRSCIVDVMAINDPSRPRKFQPPCSDTNSNIESFLASYPSYAMLRYVLIKDH